MTYGETRAVDGVDLDLAAGEIHALCGENGAGKSTLAAIATRKLVPTSGSVSAAGTAGLVHQHFELAGRLRVWENVVLGNEPRRGARLDARAARERARELGERYGLSVDPDAIVESLPVGIAQRVEILRELHREPSVLVLDEPTAVLAPLEIASLFAALRTLAARGAAILVITHKLYEVIDHAPRVSVMRAGRIVLRAETARTSEREITRAMIGSDLPPLAARIAMPPRGTFEARGLAAGEGAHALLDASFAVGAGEIVGIAGVEGNGQTALADAIAGVVAYRGALELNGTPLAGPGPKERIAAGVRVIPQDRRREALVLEWSLAANVALGDHARAPLRRGPLLDRRATAALAREIVRDFDVRAASIETHAGALSGGNQQKVVVGRALAHEPRFVLAYQPTRGIDVGAAALVHSRLVEARNAGTAVLLISFELDELFALCDRIVVLFRGTIAGALERDAFDRMRIGALMIGGAPEALP